LVPALEPPALEPALLSLPPEPEVPEPPLPPALEPPVLALPPAGPLPPVAPAPESPLLDPLVPPQPKITLPLLEIKTAKPKQTLRIIVNCSHGRAGGRTLVVRLPEAFAASNRVGSAAAAAPYEKKASWVGLRVDRL
jgi:hypothetical protein